MNGLSFFLVFGRWARPGMLLRPWVWRVYLVGPVRVSECEVVG